MNREEIFNRIQNEYCNKSFQSLNIYNLLQEYKHNKKINHKLQIINNIIIEYNKLDNKLDNSIIDDFAYAFTSHNIITKLRKDKFNKIIISEIKKNIIDKKYNYNQIYRNKIKINILDKNYNWQIINLQTNKNIYGINIIDIQNHKKLSEIINNINNENKNIIYVICNNINYIDIKNKIFTIFQTGLMNNKICYIKGIKNMINKYL